MQSKSLSLLSLLLLSTAVCFSAVAQEQPAGDSSVATIPAPTAEVVLPDVVTPVQAESDGNAPVASEGSADATSSEKTSEQAADAAAPIDAEALKALDQELNDVSMAEKESVDFPARDSLGTLELAPLPGLNESAITGPAPMGVSVSPKDLPSEQLLGRITPEVFQEMADIERGNVFLQLQGQKEKLKNDLERLKSEYRKKRLDEITEREKVVRSRIAWWQEQEKVRAEIEKQKEEEAATVAKIAEAEALRDQLREEARSKTGSDEAGSSEISIDASKTSKAIADLYVITSIRGVGGKLSAQLKDISDDSMVTVQIGDTLPSGHKVKRITKDSVFVAQGEAEDALLMKPAK